MTESLALEVINATLSFGGIKALRNVTLSVGHGQRVGLIGPNGAGKTTLVNCVAGSLYPDSGEVRLFGRSLAGKSATQRARLGIGRTFQNLEIFDSMTVRENVETALDVRHTQSSRVQTGDRHERVGEALAAFGLEGIADAPAGNLPYGIRKLVELSRAFIREPSFLLLDEPVAGLSQPESFLDALTAALDRLGCAALLIEHDMPTVRELCQHIYVLDTGAVIAQGTFAEVSKDPQVLAAYLGSESF